MYAVVRTGGKQYRVQEGGSVKVERLPGEPGDTIELGDVLLMADGDAITVGAPTIAGARVLGTIAEQGRAAKIVVFRYKAKTRSRKKTGHRQQFTRIVIDDILAAGQEPKPKAVAEAPAVEEEAPAPKARRRGRGKAAQAADAEATAAEAAARPKQRRRRWRNPPKRPAVEAEVADAETEPAGEGGVSDGTQKRRRQLTKRPRQQLAAPGRQALGRPDRPCRHDHPAPARHARSPRAATSASGRDHTLFALLDGAVKFEPYAKSRRKKVSVYPVSRRSMQP